LYRKPFFVLDHPVLEILTKSDHGVSSFPDVARPMN